MRPAARTVTAVLALISVLHVVRLVLAVPVTAGETEIPMSVSAAAVLLFGALALWLWREQRVERIR